MRAFKHPIGSLAASALLLLQWPVAPCLGTDFKSVQSDFTQNTLPVLKQFCLECHSTEKHKGDLDLERFTSLDEVIKQPKIWQAVLDQVSLGEMPPPEKPQLSAAQKEQLQTWVTTALDAAARARAGDPGPVVLRRLNNAEYTYTIRDLTGVASLDPAREFPADSASGEGFMNVGNSLVMSPALVTKYLDAAKDVAAHAVLLPDGIRFSPHTTRRDWTEQWLAEIRGIYGQFTDQGGGTSVNLQGIRFDTKDGGVLPLDKYVEATLELRASGLRGQAQRDPALESAARSDATAKAPSSLRSAGAVQKAAAEHGLSPKYLATVWHTLNSTDTNLLLDPIRARWRTAKPGDAAALAKEISRWQHALWKFNSVGHIGKKGGPTAWMEPLTPLQEKQEVKLKLPASADAGEVTLYLSASDAGDGNAGDFVVWEQPRFVAPGQPPLLLRDVREVSRELSARRERALASTAKYLAAAAEADSGRTNVAELARVHGVEADALAAWLNYLGIGVFGPAKIEGHFTTTYSNANGYAFISGWGPSGTPNLAANSSDQHVRIPGNMKPHSVAIHPSPKLAAAVGWQSPVAGRFRVTAAIQHAHPECGNGVTWSLEVRRGMHRQRLANGIAQGSKEVKPAPIENLAIQPGDVVSLLIGPRDGNHSCDLTAVDLTLTSLGEGGREWDLAKDVSPDVTAGNPHADRFGNNGVWHFYTEPDKGGQFGPVIPAGSLLAKWQSATSSDEKAKLAGEVQSLLTAAAPAKKDSPDAALHRQLTSLGGPLFAGLLRERARLGRSKPAPPPVGQTHEDENTRSNSKDAARLVGEAPTSAPGAGALPLNAFGLDPARFSGADLPVRAPATIEVRLPADLVAGYEFITTGRLDPVAGREGSVQLQVLTNRPSAGSGLLAIEAKTADGEGPWYSNNRVTSHTAPIVVNDGSAARRRIEAAFDEFRQIFPAALCYTKIVPVDEVVTLTLHYREDEHFKRLMLDDAQAARLDRLWDELRYVAEDDLRMVDVFEQLWQYATQDADPSVFEPLREPIKQRAAAFRQRLVATQPAHLDAVLEFAEGAYRRPLADAEKDELRGLYRKLRGEEIPHDEAIRLTLARVLVAPAFLYKAEKPVPGDRPGPVNDWELATRLSYFLWSSAPDAELRAVAARGKLRQPDVLAAQARRMLKDPRVRRLAIEFACAWLHVYDFDQLGEKSERHFPTFTGLRGAMYEETIRFFTDLFQNDGSVLDILDADHTFLNADLAKHYGIPDSVLRSSGRESAQTPASKPETRNDQKRLTSAASTKAGRSSGRESAQTPASKPEARNDQSRLTSAASTKADRSSGRESAQTPASKPETRNDQSRLTSAASTKAGRSSGRESAGTTEGNDSSRLTSAATNEDDGWQRVAGVKQFGRGGILAQATTLAKHSGASRTSPILRGNWLAEVILGEKLPRPPANVPQLPEDEATETLTVRQLTEKHSSDPKCYGCHRRIDPYGYSLEAYDAIGRFRDKDLGGRTIDVKTKVMDGSEIDGLDGLRHYLLTTRRDAFLKQFCRKLLGYSLGRGVLLSDAPLIDEMREQLRKHDHRVSAAIEAIVRSKQFREIRGKEMASEE